MKAESTIKPAQFKIEGEGEYVNVRFYANITTKEKEDPEDNTTIWEYDEYLLQSIRNRPNLKETIKDNYSDWLQMAIEKENEPRPETEREKIIRLEKENRQLGVELSERELQEIAQGQQISNLEVKILELRGGM